MNSVVSEYTRKQMQSYAGSLLELSRCYGKRVGSGKECEENTDRQDLFEAEKRTSECRILSDYLKEISHVMEKMAEDEENLMPLPEKEVRRIKAGMKKEKLNVLEVFYLKDQAEGSLGMIVCSSKINGHKKSEIAGLLSVLLQRKLVASSYEEEVVGSKSVLCTFVPQPKYLCVHGVARVQKEGEEVCGDNFSILEWESGKVSAILSDGMGSGEKAARDSCEVLDYLERLLESGFSPEKALESVNRLMVLREEGNMSTIDLCNLDLIKGTCQFYKVGAACSFLKSNTYVEKIENPCLPLGIWEPREQEFYQGKRGTIERELVDGDYIIMFTDGIVDALKECGYEEALFEYLERVKDQYPKDMAMGILQYTLCLSKGKIEDDMSVLVLRIFDIER